MLGKALVSHLRVAGASKVVEVTRATCDLEDSQAVDLLFSTHRPAYVYHLAAKVGGIQANINDPFGFMVKNLKMQTSVFESCLRYGVTKVAFAGSSCAYPRDCPQPMREEHLMTGPPEPTNEAYAIAKLAGVRLAAYAAEQHRVGTVCPMFCNLYGPGDSFDFDRCHVLSALVRRFCDATSSGASQVTLWGTGSACREFLHVDDAARAMTFLMDNYHRGDHINVGTGHEVSIRELSSLVAQRVGFAGEVIWDTSKPDGMPRKCLDVTRLSRLGFTPQSTLSEGIDQVIADYRQSALESFGR